PAAPYRHGFEYATESGRPTPSINNSQEVFVFPIRVSRPNQQEATRARFLLCVACVHMSEGE
ncbi:MAG: hypothetical protein M3R15_32245, partial [Acidobacteriota bacterium]|nr:hypothetical protein [Acidobacteriota bacterium]